MATSRGFDERKLSRELSTAVDGDRRRIAVDEMKKRSVMTARSYDEFRHLVACAEEDQKPLTSKELSMLGKRTPGDNQVDVNAGGSAIPRIRLRSLQKPKQTSAILSKQSDKGCVPKVAPKSSAEFHRVWRRECTTPIEKCRFLQTITGSSATKLFRMEVPDVGDVAQAWCAGLEYAATVTAATAKEKQEEKEQGKEEGDEQQQQQEKQEQQQQQEKQEERMNVANRAVDFMSGLAKSPAFGMCMTMASATDKNSLMNMFHTLIECVPKEKQEEVSQVAHTYNVVLEVDGVAAA